jgi:hypothetical protein
MTLHECRDPALMRSPERLDLAPTIVYGPAGARDVDEGLSGGVHAKARTCYGRQPGPGTDQTAPGWAQPSVVLLAQRVAPTVLMSSRTAERAAGTAGRD